MLLRLSQQRTTSALWYADIVSANYSNDQYSDYEGDAAGTILSQWFRSDTSDQTGSYTAIDDEDYGSNTQTYETTASDLNSHPPPCEISGPRIACDAHTANARRRLI